MSAGKAQATAEPDHTPSIDLDGLLSALVLAPRTFARNRFFWLFTQPGPRRARSRATQLRTVVRHLAGREGARGEVVREVKTDAERIVLSYRVPELGLLRTVTLDPLEASIVRFALHQAGAEPWKVLAESDRHRVESALAQLGNHLDVNGEARREREARGVNSTQE